MGALPDIAHVLDQPRLVPRRRLAVGCTGLGDHGRQGVRQICSERRHPIKNPCRIQPSAPSEPHPVFHTDPAEAALAAHRNREPAGQPMWTPRHHYGPPTMSSRSTAGGTAGTGCYMTNCRGTRTFAGVTEPRHLGWPQPDPTEGEIDRTGCCPLSSR
jgi:hypothetical protein